jgi:hypothetical protein
MPTAKLCAMALLQLLHEPLNHLTFNGVSADVRR